MPVAEFIFVSITIDRCHYSQKMIPFPIYWVSGTFEIGLEGNIGQPMIAEIQLGNFDDSWMFLLLCCRLLAPNFVAIIFDSYGVSYSAYEFVTRYWNIISKAGAHTHIMRVYDIIYYEKEYINM